MKVRFFLFTCFLGAYTFAAHGEKILIELNNAKLSTAVEAITNISKMNIIWDKNAIAYRDKLVSLSIQKPLDSYKLLNMVLIQNGLLAAKDSNLGVYYIKEAEEFSVAFPLDVIGTIGPEPFNRLVEYAKSIKTESAILEYDNLSYSLYYKDIKENVSKLRLFATDYSKYMQEVGQKQRELFEKKGKPIRKDYSMSKEDFKEIEESIKYNLSPYGRIFYDDVKKVIVLIDFDENIQKVSPLISKKMKSRIVSKCFYVRELEPGEIYNNIKYSELSDIGSITFKYKSIDISTIETRSGIPPQVVQVPKLMKTGEVSEEKETSVASQQMQQQIGTTPSQQVRGDYMISKLPRLCISDYPEVIDRIKYKYDRILLERPYQVQIEARIVEISSERIKDLGIQWGGQYISSNLSIVGANSQSVISPNSRYAVDFSAGTLPNQGFSFGLIAGGLTNFVDVRLSALERIGKTKLLSAPKVLTSDGETAVIRQGYEIPYITGSTATTPGNVMFKNAVLQLKVTPFTFIDGNILLNIELSKDEPDFTRQLTGGAPPIYTKTLINRISVKDGSTAVLGGILEKKQYYSERGIPRLMRIPILGNLFKNDYRQEASTELLIFISPKIVYE
ncbi:MAG: pilus assembly protein PilQ [Hydrogenothermaceae bacterium]|nr:pilus assembly protein PilQ [Hydrogenothermaceae bacterium]